MSRVYNFSAGPSMLPEPVLQKAAAEMMDYQGSCLLYTSQEISSCTVPLISPRGIMSTLEGLNTAMRFVPTPSWDRMVKLPPVISASILNSGTPKPTLRVVRVV